MKFLLTMTLALGAICILEASSSTKASTMDNDSVSTENQILLVRGGGHGGGHRGEFHGESANRGVHRDESTNRGAVRNEAANGGAVRNESTNRALCNDLNGEGAYGGGYAGNCFDQNGNSIPCPPLN